MTLMHWWFSGKLLACHAGLSLIPSLSSQFMKFCCDKLTNALYSLNEDWMHLLALYLTAPSTLLRQFHPFCIFFVEVMKTEVRSFHLTPTSAWGESYFSLTKTCLLLPVIGLV